MVFHVAISGLVRDARRATTVVFTVEREADGSIHMVTQDGERRPAVRSLQRRRVVTPVRARMHQEVVGTGAAAQPAEARPHPLRQANACGEGQGQGPNEDESA